MVSNLNARFSSPQMNPRSLNSPRPRGNGQYRRPRYNNNGNRGDNRRPYRRSARSGANYNANGRRRYQPRVNRGDDGRRQRRDQELSARRNNRTILQSQQTNMIGTDGDTYATKQSKTGRKDARAHSKKVQQNSALTEANIGNYTEEHAGNLQSLRAISEGFSNLLVRQAIWWLAIGWYVSIRKSYIRMGPASQNDKYFVNLDNPFTTHFKAVQFLENVLYVAYNNIRSKGKLLDVKLPRHICFAVTVLATKQLQRTPTGVIDMATQPYIQISAQYLITTFPKEVPFLNEITSLPAHPFPMVCEVVMESEICVYHNAKGEAIHSAMKLEEIASIYGYFTPTANPGVARKPKTVFNYDYNGFDHPSSTQLFRSAFFVIQGTDYKPELELNPQLMNNQFADPRLVMLNFAATGFIPTAEHTMFCVVPHLSTNSELASKYTTNVGLEYINVKISNSGGMQGAPLFSPNALAYNVALDLAMALQMQISNFCQIMPDSGTNPQSAFDEDNFSWATAVAQYVEKIPLPSVIFEEMKNFSDVNSWTMANKPEPTSIYYSYSSIYNTTVGKPGGGNMTLDTYFGYVTAHTSYMLEIRYWVRLNMAPEINNYMPSVHLMLRDFGNRIYSILDAESYHHKDIAMWINFSYIPQILESRPLPLTYIEVKNYSPEVVIPRLYQLALDSSFQGKSSELDAYYQRLREKQIGFFGGLSSILGAVLPVVPHLMSAIFKPKNKTKPEHPAETTKSSFSTGALVQSMLTSLINNKDFKQIAVNAPDQKRQVREPTTKKNVLATRPAMKKILRRKMLARLGR